MNEIKFFSFQNFIDKCNCYAYAIDAAVTLHTTEERERKREREELNTESIERGSHGLHASWCILKE